MRCELRSGRFQFADLRIEHSHAREPIIDVPTAIPPGYAPSATDREIHLSPSLVQLFSDLCAGLSGSDYEDRTGRQRRRILVLHRVDLFDASRNRSAEFGDIG